MAHVASRVNREKVGLRTVRGYLKGRGVGVLDWVLDERLAEVGAEDHAHRAVRLVVLLHLHETRPLRLDQRFGHRRRPHRVYLLQEIAQPNEFVLVQLHLLVHLVEFCVFDVFLGQS